MNKSVNNIQITVVIYVDDLLLTSAEEPLIHQTILNIGRELDIELKAKGGLIHSYLGMFFN